MQSATNQHQNSQHQPSQPNQSNQKSFPTLENLPASLFALKKPPEKLFYIGDTSLLDSAPKVAIIGTRHPNTYAQMQTANLTRAIIARGGVVISGGALGTDIIAHEAALPRTICVLPSSLETFYPATNAKIIAQIAQNGLILSEYERNPKPQKYDFLHRNRIVVALSDFVVIPQADLASGSLYSADICAKIAKPLFVLTHRINESLGTQELLIKGRAKPIFSIESFLQEISASAENSGASTPNARGAQNAESKDSSDPIIEFCKGNPFFEEAYLRFGDALLEYELEGKVARVNGRIVVQSQ
ncbi:DNA-processing protein DprA [Helicobacter sp. CLO-3]|uniref:DNA-processing protein DprA n=1 Tax=Helicobacter sp. CLO-3 TaxID=211 RepID=UPI0009EF4FD7|nr:DNA-processing protein DprA [Helicobacter sp. CLO-3]